VLLAFISGCALIKPAALPTEEFPLDRARTAVAFIDEANRIYYRNDYFLFFVSMRQTDETFYKENWDNSNELSDLHAAHLRKLGLNATSIYDLFEAEHIKELLNAQLQIKQLSIANATDSKNASPAIHEQLRKELLEKNMDRLVLIRANGFNVFTGPLGGKPQAFIFISNYKYNMSDGASLWLGSDRLQRVFDTSEAKVKDFLESGEFSGLKALEKELTDDFYSNPNWLVRRLIGAHR
jgi:hypothetical protein